MVAIFKNQQKDKLFHGIEAISDNEYYVDLCATMSQQGKVLNT